MDPCYHQSYEKRYETHALGLASHARAPTSPSVGQYRVAPQSHHQLHSAAVTSRHGSAWPEINNLGLSPRAFECSTHCAHHHHHNHHNHHHHATGPDSSAPSIVYGLSSASSESQPVRNLYDLYTSRSEPPVHDCTFSPGYRFHEPTYYASPSEDNYYCCNSDTPNTWNEVDPYHECSQPANHFETGSYQSGPMLRSISTHQSTFESSHSATWEEVPGPVRYTHYKVGNCNSSSANSPSVSYPHKECRNLAANAYQTRSSMSMEMSSTTKYKLMAQLSEHITIKEHNFTDIYRFRHHNVNNCYKSSKTLFSEMKQIQINSMGTDECSSPDDDSVPDKCNTTGQSGHKNNLCYICGKNYARPSTLKTHLRTHSGEKPYRCKICAKAFSQAANLTAHIRTHSGEKPFPCPVCQRRFSQSSSVTTHLRTHSGERPYCCSYCRKAFSDSSTLTKHFRIHSGEKPYQCQMCLLRFSQSGNLNRHMRIHG